MALSSVSPLIVTSALSTYKIIPDIMPTTVSTVSTDRLTTPAVLAAVNPVAISQTPTPRKRPCCTKCGKPMLGHRRGQCDVESTPTKIKVEDSDEPRAGDLTTELAALRIDQPSFDDEGSGEEKKAGIHDAWRRSSARVPKAETLESLTSNDKALLETLGKPGMMSNKVIIDEFASRANIERWLESVPNSESPKHSRQRGPPITPDREFDTVLDLPPKKSGTGNKRSLARSAKPLGRTSSVAEREEFFDQLAQKSKGPVASVFTVEMSDIQALEENAKRLRFHARVIAPKYADGSTGNGWLVVGKDGTSVENVFSDVERDVRSGKGYATTLGGIATGLVVAWTYLAFS